MFRYYARIVDNIYISSKQEDDWIDYNTGSIKAVLKSYTYPRLLGRANNLLTGQCDKETLSLN